MDVVASEAVTSREAAIVQASLDAIVSIDRRGIITEFNPAAEKLFGWTRAEAMGSLLGELIIPPEFAALHQAGIQRFLATGEAHMLNNRTELPARHRDGTLLKLDLLIVRTSSGGREEFTGFARDITEIDKTRQRLAVTQQRYEAIVRHSHQAMILCGSPTEQSSFIAGEDVLGFAEGTRLPGGFLDVVHPDDTPRASDFVEGVRSGRDTSGLSIDLRLRTASGSYRICEVSAEDLSRLPAVGGILIRAEDVTLDRQRRRQLEDRTAQMRALINNLGSAVLLEDATRHVLVVNGQFTAMFGVPIAPDDLVGTDCARSAHQVKAMFADPEGFVTGVDESIAATVPQLGVQLPLSNGRGTLERDYVPILSGNRLVGHLWAYRDITRQIEETQLLSDQNRSLAELASLKNEFVARVSHELRSPLTSVVSFADMLAESSTGLLDEEQSTFVDIILRNSRRLLRLIEDLLLVAKLESHTLPLALGLVDLPALAHQVVMELQPRATDAGSTLNFVSSSGPRVRGDPVRLQQVISNLIGNAITYTPRDGSITVKVLPSQDDRVWVLSVTDTGIGIPADDLPRLFEAFYRTGSSQKFTPKGTGLGLAIVRLIVDEHHGSVSVNSAVGVGTTMTVWLPFEEI